MSWLSDRTGIHLGNIGAPIGALVGSIVPGVGTALGAGLGQAIGGVGHGDGLGKSALEGAGVYAGGKMLGSALGHMGSVGGAAGSIGGALGGLGKALPGVASIGQFLGNHGGVGGLLSQYGAPALMAAQGLNAANLGKKSGDYANRAMDSVQQSYDSRAPLRAQGISRMLTPPTANLGGLASVAGNNPYAPKPAASMMGAR